MVQETMTVPSATKHLQASYENACVCNTFGTGQKKTTEESFVMNKICLGCIVLDVLMTRTSRGFHPGIEHTGATVFSTKSPPSGIFKIKVDPVVKQ